MNHKRMSKKSEFSEDELRVRWNYQELVLDIVEECNKNSDSASKLLDLLTWICKDES